MKQFKKGISIIICTYNGAERLPETLRCILKQEKTNNLNVEVIVIDNASTDGTADVARNLWQESRSPFEFKILFEQKPGKSNALITGFDNAQYEYLLICDDDNRLFPDYFLKAFEIMESNPSVGVLGGQGIPDYEINPPDWINNYQIAYGVGPQNEIPANCLTEVHHVYGAGSVLRKNGWLKLKNIGFKSLLPGRVGKKLLSGEDVEMSLVYKMMGYKIAWSPELKFNHFLPKNRIKWNYLKKLYICFGRAKNYLYIYYNIEKYGYNPQSKLRIPLWLNRSIFLIKYIIQFKTEHHLWFLKESEKISNNNYLSMQASKGELYELLLIRGKYSKKYDFIIDIKNKLKQQV